MDDLSLTNAMFTPEDNDLEKNWNRIYDKISQRGLSTGFTWFKSCAEACNRFALKTNVIEIKDNNTDKVVALIPYIIRQEKIYHFLKVNSLHLMRLHKEYGDHYDLLIDPEYYFSSIKLLIVWMTKNSIDVCFLNNIHDHSKLISLISIANRFRFLASTDQRIASSCIWLPTLDKYKQWSSGKFKRIMQYKRKLERTFKVSYGMIQNETELSEILSVYNMLHTQRFANKGEVSTVCSDPVQFHFLERLTHNALETGILRADFIKIEDKIVSLEISFHVNNKLYAYTAAFDEEYSHYRIGSIQTLVLLEKAIEQGIDVIDLLQGDESYKKIWAQKTNFDYNLTIFPKTLYGYSLFIITLLRRPLQIAYRLTRFFKSTFSKAIKLDQPRVLRT